MSNFKYFKWSLIVTIIGLIGGGFLGGPKGVVIVAILAVLETSLSFDNAVVNATVLKNMDEKWRKRFMVWGMFIAVGVMRLAFPLLIVGVVAHMGPVAVFDMAIHNKELYAKTLTSAHHQIAAFGGAFLLMVFLKFFIDAQKEEHWVHVIEAPLQKLGRLDTVEVALTLIAVLVSASFMPDAPHSTEFIVAGILGLVTYIVADGIGAIVGGDEAAGEGANVGVAVAKTGLAGFLYLELLDASFSFDGVIGAFALSNDLFIITLGLCIGAMFVRSMTLMLVDKGTLSEYRFLEHGAFWAIGALAAVMFIGVHVEIPEVVTGLIGAGFIGLALVSSIVSNRREAVA